MKKYLFLLLPVLLLLPACNQERSMEPDPIISETTVGVYGISQTDYVYKPVDCQLSRTYDAQGTLTLRILKRMEGGFCQVSGIKTDAEKGDSFTVGILVTDDMGTVLDSTTEVEVLQVDNSLLWLKAREGEIRMIVKK